MKEREVIIMKVCAVRYNRNKKGFTLVEIVVVIAILGILAAIAVPLFSSARPAASRKIFAAREKSRRK